MQIVIIGNGISGITAAREIRKKTDFNITIISSESPHFFSRTALMYVYMGHMKFEHTKPYEDHFWVKNKIDLVYDFVEGIDFEKSMVKLKSGDDIKYDKLIIATGSKPNMPNIKGIDLKNIQGLYHKQDLDQLESITERIERAVVVGGGLIGIELVEMLLSRGKKVTFLVRESSFWNAVLPAEESEMINQLIYHHDVDLRLNTEVEAFEGDELGNVKAVKTKLGETIDCQMVGMTIGVSPNIALVDQTTLATNRGILINEFFETNVPNVYAIGDVAEHLKAPFGRRNIEQIWYTGRIMGETLAHNIAGRPTPYAPGIFFNSAKFFDLEYQTYGEVLAEIKEDQKDFLWQSADYSKLVRIRFQKDSKTVLGVNTFGIRMRHEIWEKWLSKQTQIEQVIEDLDKANFDPEFFKKYENEIIDKFNADFQASVPTKKTTKFFKIFS